MNVFLNDMLSKVAKYIRKDSSNPYKHWFDGLTSQAAGNVEDMASMLTDTAKSMHFSLGIAKRDVLERVHLGQVSGSAVVT